MLPSLLRVASSARAWPMSIPTALNSFGRPTETLPPVPPPDPPVVVPLEPVVDPVAPPVPPVSPPPQCTVESTAPAIAATAIPTRVTGTFRLLNLLMSPPGSVQIHPRRAGRPGPRPGFAVDPTPWWGRSALVTRDYARA